jgi:hypothetical protein
MSHLKNNSFNGLSERIQFDAENGVRNNLTFSIVNKVKDSIYLVKLLVNFNF